MKLEELVGCLRSMSQEYGCLIDQAAVALEAERAEVIRLKEAIRAHRAQKADDRCIEDDDHLYAALKDGIKCDRRVGNRVEMLKNCARFISRRCEGGHWPTYAELEQEVARLKAENESLRCKPGW